MKNKKHMSNKALVLILIVVAILIAAIPLFTLKGANFGGSDNAGTQMIQKIDKNYQPWFTPVLEKAIGGPIPTEVESLLFSIQTGIGVGIMAFLMGRLVERKKWTDKLEQEKKKKQEKEEEIIKDDRKESAPENVKKH